MKCPTCGAGGEKKILETVREFVLSRQEDIENDIEDFGMLAPVLEHFLEEGGM